MLGRTACLALIVIVLGIYYPVLFAGINSLDDFRMIEELPKAGTLDFINLFNPIGTAAGYYRPLIMLSYYLDQFINGGDEQVRHLMNIAIHLFNTLLIFGVGLTVFKKQNHRVELSFLAACVFSLHPVNVESVAWISGRTDLLASLFALLSLISLYRFIDSEKLPWLWCAALLCVIGSLAKETALFCLPAVFLLACANDVRLRSAFAEKRAVAFLVRAGWMVLPFLLTGTAYLSVRLLTLKYVTRSVATTGGDGGGGNVFASMLRLMRELLVTYGFYIKKLFLPLPLNFAITEVHAAYFWLGLAALLLVIYCLVRRQDSIAVQMMLATLIVMASAFVISRARVAWTPYAERYLYLPTVFFVFGIVDVGHRLSVRYISGRTGVVTAFILLGLMTGVTAQRAMIWQSNLTLYQDTIRKSPDFGCISNELAIALIDNNRLDEATAQIEHGKMATNQGDMTLLYVNQALILGGKKQYEEAYNVLASTYKDKDIGSAHIEVIKSYINLIERERVYTKDLIRSHKLLSRLADMHELYYKRSGDTDHLYRAAQLALAGGDRHKSHALFVAAAERAPKESMYKEFARKMVKKTEESSPLP